MGLRNRTRVWELTERITERIANLREAGSAEKRYDLRDEEDLLQVRPTNEEVDSGVVKNAHNCPDCQIYQIERTTDDEDMKD